MYLNFLFFINKLLTYIFKIQVNITMTGKLTRIPAGSIFKD